MEGYEAVLGALVIAVFLFVLLGYQLWTERKETQQKNA